VSVPVRVVFDLSLPFAAAQPFSVGDKRFATDEEVDWRGLGVTELQLRTWYSSGLVYCKQPDAAAAGFVASGSFVVATSAESTNPVVPMSADPGDRVDVETPHTTAPTTPTKNRSRK
jgi:hypothetical protein